MPESSPAQAARQMLQRQLEALSSVYNAGVRSPNFRMWRQATLTCIQRIWPAEPGRPERFRRIPFSPPMGRPGDREVREYFERGCGEVGSLLKEYIKEVESSGVPQPGPGALPVAPPGAGMSDDDFPTVDLPGPGGDSQRAGSSAVPPRPRLKDLLGFSDKSHSAPPVASAPNDSSAAPPSPLRQAPVPAPSAEAPAQGAPPLGQGGVDQAMAELESHGFFAPPGRASRDASATGPAPLPKAPTAAVPTPPAQPAVPQPRIVVTGTEQPASAQSSAQPPAARSGVPALEPDLAAAAAAARPDDPDDLERVADELLRASSALSSLPRRSNQDRRPRDRDLRTPIAIAVAALALEVDALGVPDGHRSRARALLLDLARRLEAPSLSWDELRDAMNFVMEHPSLGRRVVPLLLPYLDRAA